MKKIVFTILVVLISLAAGAAGIFAQSQPTQAFVTWRAENFYPSYFEGRVLPSSGSSVSLAVEVTQGGILRDLAQADIGWQVDGKFIGSGRGMKQAKFTATKGSGNSHFVRVSIAQNSELVEVSVRIPTTAPTVVIDAPYVDKRGTEGKITLSSLPYFFNASSLDDFRFSWTIDGERREVGSDTTLTIADAASIVARTFRIDLEALNTLNPMETATARNQFAITP